MVGHGHSASSGHFSEAVASVSVREDDVAKGLLKTNFVKYEKVSASNESPDSSDDFDWGGNIRNTGREVVAQLRVIVQLGFPNTIERLAGFLPSFFLIVFMGLLGADEIAGAGVGFMLGNVTGISMIMGFSLGLAPLASHAFGAQNYSRVGALLERQILILFIGVVPLVVLCWLYSETMLIAVGQPPAIAALAGEYLRWRVPAIPFLALAEALSGFLKAQRVMVPTMILMLGLNLLSVVLAFAFISPRMLNLGFKGGPLALTIVNVLQGIALLLFTRSWLTKPTWPAWSRESLRVALKRSNVEELLAVSIPASLVMWSEWWAFEANVLLSGLLCGSSHFKRNLRSAGAPRVRSLPVSSATCTELDVSPIVSNILFLTFYMHYGFTLGAATHVANMMGAGYPSKAKLAALINIALVFAISVLISVILLRYQDTWGLLFTTNREVLAVLPSLWPILAAYIPLDSVGVGALNVLLRAIGIVRVPAGITFFAFWVVGIPTGAALAFQASWGISGLWIGPLLAEITMILGLGYLFLRANWSDISQETRRKALLECPVDQDVATKIAEAPSPFHQMDGDGPSDVFLSGVESDAREIELTALSDKG